MRWRSRLLAHLSAGAVILGMALVGCTSAPSGDPEGLTVYATTGYLADLAANLAPEAEIITMVGPGGDAHTYQPSTRDIQRLLNADLVLWNGLQLEAQMTDQLTSLGDRQLAVAEQLPEELLPLPETDSDGHPLHDPHVWNSPQAWALVVDEVADKLAAVDPESAADYQTNAERYRAEIAAADRAAEELLAGVAEPRLLITGHDAFAYFGATYDLQVQATDFISSEAQLSATQLSELARLIAEQRVPVIFLDNQANPQAIRSLQEAVHALGWDVKVSDQELYADSLGAAPGVDTYLGVLGHNARAIADGLGKE